MPNRVEVTGGQRKAPNPVSDDPNSSPDKPVLLNLSKSPSFPGLNHRFSKMRIPNAALFIFQDGCENPTRQSDKCAALQVLLLAP